MPDSSPDFLFLLRVFPDTPLVAEPNMINHGPSIESDLLLFLQVPLAAFCK